MKLEIQRDAFVEKSDTGEEKLVNVEALQSLVESSEAELDDDLVPPKRIGPAVGWAGSTGAVLLTLALAFWAVDQHETPAEVETNLADASPVQRPVDVKPKPAINPEGVEARIVDGVAQIEADSNVLITISEHRGSRYETLAERAKSVELRLRHVVGDASAHEDEPGRFGARRNGEVYEVVWMRAEKSPFRILDVTPNDVKAWKKQNGETNRSILANVIADELNAALYAKPIPTS